MVVCDALVESF